MDLSGIELGPKMLACTERERRFVVAYLQNGGRDATDAARTAGFIDNDTGAIRVQAHMLMHRQRVLDALKEVGNKYFQSLLIPSVMAMEKLVSKPDHPDHAKTVFSVLSRLGLTERTGVDVNHTGEVTVNHTDQAVEDLRIMRQMGASREKLLEAFGFSGLPRLEKMLEQAELVRAVKTIEHQVSASPRQEVNDVSRETTNEPEFK